MKKIFLLVISLFLTINLGFAKCPCGDNCKCKPQCACEQKCTCGDDCKCGDNCKCKPECACDKKCNCSENCTCGKKVKFSPFHPGPVVTDDMKFYKNFADEVKKERSAVSNALQLTKEQAKCRVEITRKHSAELDEKFHTLYDENLKLKALKAEKATKSAIKAQEKNINCVKKEIKKIVEEENSEFKKILDREQRAKLRMIQKLERKAMKCTQKDYYKSNPKMRQFAPQAN